MRSGALRLARTILIRRPPTRAETETLTFALLYLRFRRPHPAGAIIGLYLVLYAFARFVIEFYRAPDQPNPFGGSLTSAQWISVALFVLGALALARRTKPQGR